jgi:hypothetical protein
VTRLAVALSVLLVASSAAAASSDPWHARGQTLRADVDGDGRADAVLVEQRGRRCVFRLVAGSFTARLRPAGCEEKPAELTSGPDPHVAALVPIDRNPGLEIVVQLGHGAYMEFADLWTVRHGTLRRFGGHEPHVSYGSSAGTGGHVVDCARPGVVLVSDQSYPPHGRIVRRWYDTRSLRLKLLRTRALTWNSERAPPFHEFREPQPFPTCARAR